MVLLIKWSFFLRRVQEDFLKTIAYIHRAHKLWSLHTCQELGICRTKMMFQLCGILFAQIPCWSGYVTELVGRLLTCLVVTTLMKP